MSDIVYVADQARQPYGEKSLSQVAHACNEIADWLIEHGASTIVIACNTASAAALEELRFRHPNHAFVGMEPAVKPAAVGTRTGVVGVLATGATFQGELFASVVDRHAEGVRVLTVACPEWVEMVESGETNGEVATAKVARRVRPLIDEGADSLVLGCTHFPFLKATIAEIVGVDVELIDPAPAVAKQVARLHLEANSSGQTTLVTSGDPASLGQMARRLVGIDSEVLALGKPWQ
jgi:glutamate racemase